MFGFKKKVNRFSEKSVEYDGHTIVAPAEGKQIAIELVKDVVFSQKMMGEGIAFEYEGDTVTICAPANGELTVLFPTGHAFGITMDNGVEVLVHIGIDTVEAKGDGFDINPNYKQGDRVQAGNPLVIVDLKKLRQNYDLTLMLIVTNANGETIEFPLNSKVDRGTVVARW